MSEQRVEKSRMPFISMLRIVAAFAVVVIHSRLFANHISAAYDFVYAVVLWSVPVFFMITGYIFLGIKQNVDYKDIWKYVLRFAVVLVVLGMFYSLSERVFIARAFDVKMIWLALVDVIENN